MQNISVRIKNVWQISILSKSAILNNQIQPVSETRLSSLAMTLVLSHWLTAKPFVLSLYKCNTTRMVGRPVKYIAIYTSLLVSVKQYFMENNKVSSSTTPLNIFLDTPQIITHSCISLIPNIYPHSLYFINLPHSQQFINPSQIPSQPTSH